MDFVRDHHGLDGGSIMTIEKLKAEAKDLGIEYDDEVTEDVLQGKIDAKKEELNKDADHLRKEVERLDEEARKAYDRRDKANKEKRTLSKKVEELQTQIDNMVDSKQLKELETEMKELKKFKKEMDEAEEEAKLKEATELERVSIRHKKELEELQKQIEELSIVKEDVSKKASEDLEEARAEIDMLRGVKLETDIIKAAAKFDAWNPEQIVTLTKGFFEYDKNLDSFSHFKRDAKNKIIDELGVGEFIETFLSKEENENLIKSKINKGSLQSKKQKSSDTSDAKTKTKGKEYDPTDPDIIKAAEMESLSPEDYISLVLVKRDEAFARVKTE